LQRRRIRPRWAYSAAGWNLGGGQNPERKAGERHRGLFDIGGVVPPHPRLSGWPVVISDSGHGQILAQSLLVRIECGKIYSAHRILVVLARVI
jgi:hypothetical protein